MAANSPEASQRPAHAQSICGKPRLAEAPLQRGLEVGVFRFQGAQPWQLIRSSSQCGFGGLGKGEKLSMVAITKRGHFSGVLEAIPGVIVDCLEEPIPVFMHLPN